LALAAAAERGAVRPLESLEDLIAAPADLLVVAAPPTITVDVLAALETDALVLDVCSVKVGPVAAASHLARFVGTHPMAGREVSGPEAASPVLFRGATWVVATDGASPADLLTVEEIVGLLGARPVRMSAAEHDAAVSLVSHLPQVVAAALVLEAGGDERALGVAAGSFRDLTRVAASDPAMWTAVLEENRGEVLAAIGRLQARLDSLARDLADGEGRVEADLAAARRVRESLGAAAEPVRVALADRPGELARVGHALEASGVDVRDIQLRHAPYGGGGVLTVAVHTSDVANLRAALIAEGLLLID